METVILQVLCGAATAVCFAILFNVRRQKLPIIACGSAAACGIYLLVNQLSGAVFLSLFCASCFVSILSEVLARRKAAPVTTFLVPFMIPLFPGGDLYRAAAALVQQDASFPTACRTVFSEAGALVSGIAVVACLVQLLYRLLHRRQQRLYRAK